MVIRDVNCFHYSGLGEGSAEEKGGMGTSGSDQGGFHQSEGRRMTSPSDTDCISICTM